jgi:beta-lactam-binding protein with PASTA domain
MPNILKDKRVRKHILLVSVTGIGFIVLIIMSLNAFTRHGQEIKVPDLTGFYLEEIKGKSEYNDFELIVVDSIYDLTREKGSIVSQDPEPNSLVKSGRKIYLTVVSKTPQLVDMPNLLDLSLRNAKSVIETYGLNITKLSYVPDIAQDAVVEQKYRGLPIKPGTRILKGSGIELVLGLGENSALLQMPILIGLTRSEAIKQIHLSSLNLGNEHFDTGDDTSAVRVYRQNPNFAKNTNVQKGQTVELWYKSNQNFNFEEYLLKIQSQQDSIDAQITE